MHDTLWTVIVRLTWANGVKEEKFFTAKEPTYAAEGNRIRFFEEETCRQRVFGGSRYHYEVVGPPVPFAK